MSSVLPINFHRLPAGITAQEVLATAQGLTNEQVRDLLYCWELWSRPEQEWPDGFWRTWLILAGRGFGKTRTGAESVRQIADANPRARIALIAPTAADCRDVLVEGESGLMNVYPPHRRPIFEPSKRKVTFPNGAIGILYSAEEPERLRGPQHHAGWLDEIAVYPWFKDLWSNYKFGLRLGNDPRTIATTTPKPVKFLRELIEEPGTMVTRGSTYDNRANLPATVLADFERIYGGTRIGRQELKGELLEESEGALWTQANIDRCRVKQADVPALERVVIAIDPATTSGESSDDTGISAFGLGADGHGYVLADDTCHLPPAQWAARAVMLYDRHEADRIIGETNNGGDLVETTIRTERRNIPYQKVHASRGKVARAEPVAALYEQGKIHHVGSFDALEDEMVNFVPGEIKRSPNRVDALVWGASYLMLKPQRIGRALGI
jgi:phage terminase large subunit-like protein